MMRLLTIILLVTVQPRPMPSLEEIGRVVHRIWNADASTARMRVACAFHMVVEHQDPALGDAYFPNYGSHDHPLPQLHWEEDIAIRGSKTRSDFRNHHAPSLASGRPSGFLESDRFNGIQSWSYVPEDKVALQFSGSNSSTRLYQDYYRDAVGASTGTRRSTAGGPGNPFRLDHVIASGLYRAVRFDQLENVLGLVLEDRSRDTLWLGADLGWAIVKREWHWSRGGPIKRRIHNSDFREVSPGVWLPFASRIEIFGSPATRPGTRVGILHLSVTTLELDISEQWFEPLFDEGTLVVDFTTGERARVASSETSIDQTVARASSIARKLRPRPWWQWPSPWGFVLLGGLMLGIAMVLSRRMGFLK